MTHLVCLPDPIYLVWKRCRVRWVRDGRPAACCARIEDALVQRALWEHGTWPERVLLTADFAVHGWR